MHLLANSLETDSCLDLFEVAAGEEAERFAIVIGLVLERNEDETEMQ